MDNAQKAMEPTRSGSVSAEIDSLHSSITNMEDLVGLLHDRLAPVLVETPVPDATQTTAPMPERSMLAKGLAEFASRQDRVSLRLEQLLHDISL